MGLLTGTTTVYFLTQPALPAKSDVVLKLDCSVSEKHARESPPTELEVEDGQTISDHIIVKQFQLHIQGIITDSPMSLVSLATLGGLAGTVAGRFVPLLGAAAPAVALAGALDLLGRPSLATYKALLGLQEDKAPLTVVTSLYTYQNMFIRNITVPRDARTGRMLLFDMDLVQLLLVAPQTLSVAQFAAPDLSAGKADVGKKDPTHDASPAFKAGLAKGTF